jgi:hypothetical protein
MVLTSCSSSTVWRKRSIRPGGKRVPVRHPIFDNLASNSPDRRGDTADSSFDHFRTRARRRISLSFSYAREGDPNRRRSKNAWPPSKAAKTSPQGLRWQRRSCKVFEVASVMPVRSPDMLTPTASQPGREAAPLAHRPRGELLLKRSWGRAMCCRNQEGDQPTHRPLPTRQGIRPHATPSLPRRSTKRAGTPIVARGRHRFSGPNILI